ncbi:MAG TPA: MFS transporter [Solirubrobacteraceae bacterium]|jgi:MFS family permease|nr:MFS transporter [Solirubrobacteraceae bacterium]
MSSATPDATSSDTPGAPAAVAGGGFGPGFWAVAFAFLIVMAAATLPSPLYGLYRERDGLSAFTVTIIYAIYAAGTIATLLSVRYVAARIGRRGMMLSAVATMIAATALLAAWKALPGLLVGRFITGVAVGLAAGTAITYLIELRVRANPKASVIPARNIGTAVNVGALGIGPLVAGILAEWVAHPLTVPYLLWIGLGVIALIGLSTAPETSAPAHASAAPAGKPAGSSSRSVKLLVPASVATLAAFAANGLFAGLSGLFLAITFHHSSHALSGATLFLVFASGVAAQLATSSLPAARVFVLGTFSMVIGLALLVISVRLSTPNLALFLISGALIGAGAGALFKGTTGLVLDATAPENRLAMTSDLLIALFVGLSIPVIGAGIALDQGASPPDTVLVFAIVVGLGVACAGAWLGQALRSSQRPAGAPSIQTPPASA